jgi:uncharacterized tellurite resistance protein B-like protein
MMGTASAYLTVNKLWSRKHIPDVAASISIPGTILELIPTFIFGLYYFVNAERVGFIDSIIWVVVATFTILIGSGFWVQGQRGAGILNLVWRSVRSEREELGNLAQSLLHPGSSRPLVELLQRLAEVDGEVSEKEIALITEVAEKMNVKLSIAPRTVTDARTKRLLRARDALQRYLMTSPPLKIVEKLQYLMHQLNIADGHEHEDEKHAFDELNGAILSYLDGSVEMPVFRVLIAPQSEDQISRIVDLLADAKLHGDAGGRGITAGEFHTREYADTVCNEFRDLGFFCVVTDEVAA